MNTLWHKVRADLWLSKSRSLLAIASIAIGVFCVGTLFGMIDLQLSKMDAAHRQSQPSHINLILRGDADNGLLERIKALPGVAGIDSMTPVTMHFRRSGQTEWTLATLMIRPDYTDQRYDQTGLDSGAWPSSGQVAVENLSAAFGGFNISDQLEFQTVEGTKTLPIIGIVRHPFVKPPKFGGQPHFFADASSSALFGVPANSFRQLLVQITPPYSADRARAVAVDIRNLLARHQLAVNVSLLQDPDKHWGRPFLAGVNGVLKIMALVSLALASVLILNTIAAHIAQQTDQIGVMKALGARTSTIAAVYFSETLLLALVGVLLALPFSLAAAYFSSCQLLGLFNIDCGRFEVSKRAIYWMVLGGLLAPVLAAVGPVLRGASMTVRVAIASYGLGADFGYSRLDSWVERFGARFLPTLHAAALGNLFRRKARLVLTQGVLILAGVMFLVLMSLITSLNLTLDNEMARSRYAVLLGFSIDQPESKVVEIAGQIAESGKVEVWRRLPMEMSKNGRALRQKGSLGAQLLALPADSKLYRPLIEAGRWLNADDAGQRRLLISADSAELNGIRVGDWLDITIGAASQAWRVIGTYRWLAGGNPTVEPVYASLETLRDITPGPEMASFALIDAPITDLNREADYLRRLKQAFQQQGIELNAYATQAKLAQRQFARNQFNPVIGTLSGLACMIAAVGGIGLSGALAIGVLQRTREIGVLRAIGASSKAVYRLFMLEGLLQGIVAWLLSLPLAYVAAEPVSRQLGEIMLGIQLDFAFDWWAVGYWLAILSMLAWLASYWPARKAAGLTVRESLGH
ncbi:ABC transporter permease [Methylomonas sp. LL1]|uniref:ABC transporter permease n=1 Tax=Methylomonas sp. LL1 TaxID=2785785 RepID=UPI0018C3F39C|nr:ABC transporter permease [Methylomonas sp. LL1]QPK63179.1 ABC transporter permease [Methylomonas sp. LL1]